MAYIGKQPVVGNFQVCDAISVVNGQAAYTMQVGSANVEPENANHMLVSLNGVLQKPGSSFTISGATITFASNLATNDVIDFIILLGDTLSVGTPSDDSVGAAQIKNDLISGTTALTSSPDDTDELLISDAGVLKRVDVSLVGGANTPAFEAYLNANQSVSDNTATKVAFNVEHFDTDNAYDNSTNYRFTPQTSGKYFVYADVTNYAGDSNLVKAKTFIYKNGSAIKVMQTNFKSNYARQMHVLISSVIDMNGSSDYIEIFGVCDSNSGSGQLFNGTTSAGEDRCFFGAYKLIT